MPKFKVMVNGKNIGIQEGTRCQVAEKVLGWNSITLEEVQ